MEASRKRKFQLALQITSKMRVWKSAKTPITRQLVLDEFAAVDGSYAREQCLDLILGHVLRQVVDDEIGFAGEIIEVGIYIVITTTQTTTVTTATATTTVDRVIGAHDGAVEKATAARADIYLIVVVIVVCRENDIVRIGQELTGGTGRR